MADRVKVILPERFGSEEAHVGKTGVMTMLDRSTGRADVVFDSGEFATIDACCLQYQASGDLVDDPDDYVAERYYDKDAAWWPDEDEQ